MKCVFCGSFVRDFEKKETRKTHLLEFHRLTNLNWSEDYLRYEIGAFQKSK